MSRNLRFRSSALVLVAALTSVELTGCNRSAGGSANTVADGGATTGANPSAALALPLTTGAATAPMLAPVAYALPPAPRPPVARVTRAADRYAYIDQAYAMSNAIGQAPPDYAFQYQGVRPWVWRTSANAVRLVEPTQGGYRDYYFQPGADQPYLVQDPQYAYGFSDGQLVSVYGDNGQLLSPDEIYRLSDWAGRYLLRARYLYDASLREQRESVIAANWAARRAAIDAERAQWAQEQADEDDWRAYHEEHQAEQQAYWRAENVRREQTANAFDSWSDRGYDGPPPPPAYYAPGPGYASSTAATAVGAGLLGGVAGYFIGRHDRHDTPPAPSPAGAHPAGSGFTGGAPGFGAGPRPLQGQGSNQAQLQADAVRQAQLQSQQQALAQARQQQASADAAHQAQAQAQVRSQQAALVQAQRQQAQVDAARQAQAQAQQQASALARGQQAQADAARQARALAQQNTAVQAQRQQAEAAATRAQAQQVALAARQQQALARAQNEAQTRAAQAQAAQARAAQAQAVQAQAQANAARAQQARLAAQSQMAAARAAAEQQAQARAQQAAAQAQRAQLSHVQEQAATERRAPPAADTGRQAPPRQTGDAGKHDRPGRK